MIVYSENKFGNQSRFVKSILDEQGNLISERKVSMPLYQIEEGEFVYFIQYDDHMKPITSVYNYLNFKLKESPLTSRSKAAFALRLLYCFSSLSVAAYVPFRALLWKVR